MKRPPAWLVTGVVVSVAVAVAFAAILVVPIWLHPPLSDSDLSAITDAEKRVVLQQAQAQLQNATRATLLQAFAGLILVAGALATWRQVNISRHGQITERITKAVDQLAGARMDARIGGVFALERVAKNSVEDRNTITAIISAFIRTQAPWTAANPTSHQHEPVPANEGPPWPGTRGGDVQIALYAIARRPQPHKTWDPFLSFSDLSHARMGNRDWRGLVCQYTNLTHAWMPNARLDDAYLNGTDFRNAHMVGTSLTNAKLNDAHLAGADLRNADFSGADLSGACLDDADLTGARWNQHTKWPEGFAPPGNPRRDPTPPGVHESPQHVLLQREPRSSS
ncbi:pentapeptide repeat-containing protein [Actinoplanes sp. NPDC049668]|uniref:pentapeptide repeat-containing protein n=1 Tax=unclassified Actinoplanes TaxID=2626549 RepID=UPI0033BD4322